jgi:hypothetical protein
LRFRECAGTGTPGAYAIERALTVEEIPVVERANIMGFLGNALRDAGAHREALAYVVALVDSTEVDC